VVPATETKIQQDPPKVLTTLKDLKQKTLEHIISSIKAKSELYGEYLLNQLKQMNSWMGDGSDDICSGFDHFVSFLQPEQIVKIRKRDYTALNMFNSADDIEENLKKNLGLLYNVLKNMPVFSEMVEKSKQGITDIRNKVIGPGGEVLDQDFIDSILNDFNYMIDIYNEQNGTGF